MQRKILNIAGLIFMIGILTGYVRAAEFNVFGPVTFERHKGKPAVETVEFAGPAAGHRSLSAMPAVSI